MLLKSEKTQELAAKRDEARMHEQDTKLLELEVQEQRRANKNLALTLEALTKSCKESSGEMGRLEREVEAAVAGKTGTQKVRGLFLMLVQFSGCDSLC
jgi:hypothetical protein